MYWNVSIKSLGYQFRQKMSFSRGIFHSEQKRQMNGAKGWILGTTLNLREAFHILKRLKKVSGGVNVLKRKKKKPVPTWSLCYYFNEHRHSDLANGVCGIWNLLLTHNSIQLMPRILMLKMKMTNYPQHVFQRVSMLIRNPAH